MKISIKVPKAPKGKKRDRDDDHHDDNSILDMNTVPRKGSIQAVFLPERALVIPRYSEWIAKGWISFSILPWDIIEQHILVYLDHDDIIAMARTTRLWYRRAANVACDEFAMFIDDEYSRLELEYTAKHGYSPIAVDHYREVKGSLNKLTPMAIAYYNAIGKVVWNRDCIITTVLTEKSRKWDLRKIMDDVANMLKRIEEHGNIDSFKAYSRFNNRRLDDIFRAEAERKKEVLETLRIMILEKGYDLNFEMEFRYESRQIRFKPRDRCRGNDSLFKALHDGDEETVRNFNVKLLILRLESDKLVTKRAY